MVVCDCLECPLSQSGGRLEAMQVTKRCGLKVQADEKEMRVALFSVVLIGPVCSSPLGLLSGGEQTVMVL